MNNPHFSIFNSQYNAVVLAAGTYPTHSFPLQILANAETVVCCDGAAEAFLAKGGTPTAIVGDGDSLPKAFKQQYAHLLHLESEQETNDLSKAVHYLMRQGKKRIAIVGATGKREDHTLGNISLLIEYMRQGADVQMFTDFGVFIPCSGKSSFDVSVGQQISLFNFGATGFKSQGLKYPIYDFTNWWQGTLNEATLSQVTIDAVGDYLVYLPY
jgi:thiamine pyrophosphokinase